ncbi:MAG: Re/Si-specific NAD(P)(+) transhydrogenase subunit alpha [Myxococcota bacterium]
MAKALVLREQGPDERRVAATPETVKKFIKAGMEVSVVRGAGEAAHFPDQLYQDAGAHLVDDAAAAASEARLVMSVGPLVPEAVLEAMGSGAVLVGFIDAYRRLDQVRVMASRGLSVLAMEMVPRITRAQSMDALSSQANIAGYKSVLEAARRLDKYFPLLMTAAGTVQPARVVVMGAGVAGLQAIATARRLGAVVEVSDIRPEVKEQVESLGGKFIELPMQESGAGEGGYAKEMSEDFLRKQREIVSDRVANADVVITTALIPGRPAPKLLPKEMVERMRPGAVIVDLAVAQGGNCELSKPDQDVEHGGVVIVGAGNLPSSLSHDASLLYARNIWALVSPTLAEGDLRLDLDDDVIGPTLLTHGGEVRSDAVKARLEESAA